MDRRIERLVRSKLRAVGRQYESARHAYREGRDGDADGERERRDAEDAAGSLPRDGQGRVRIVCRRHAERRAVALEDDLPACFDPEHPDCRGCAEDVREGSVETW